MGLSAVHSTPLFTTDGAILGMLSTHFRSPRKFSQDELRITDLYARQASIAIERKRAEAALIAARESADRANKAKSHFVRAASHDLRQSVQTLTLLNGILRNSTLDTNGRTALRQQSEAIDTMMHLLDALLNISKLESGAVAPEVSDFAVDDAVRKAAHGVLQPCSEQRARTEDRGTGAAGDSQRSNSRWRNPPEFTFECNQVHTARLDHAALLASRVNRATRSRRYRDRYSARRVAADLRRVLSSGRERNPEPAGLWIGPGDRATNCGAVGGGYPGRLGRRQRFGFLAQRTGG